MLQSFWVCKTLKSRALLCLCIYFIYFCFSNVAYILQTAILAEMTPNVIYGPPMTKICQICKLEGSKMLILGSKMPTFANLFLLQILPKVIYGSPMTKICILLRCGGRSKVPIWGFKNAKNWPPKIFCCKCPKHSFGGVPWPQLAKLAFFLGGGIINLRVKNAKICKKKYVCSKCPQKSFGFSYDQNLHIWV